MSHNSSIKCQIRSIDSLKKACDALGFTLQKGGTYRSYYGSQPADYVIKLRNSPYDIGLLLQQDGTYDISADFWQNHIAKEAGENCGLLLQEVGAQAAIEAAQMRGMSIYRTYDSETEEVVLEMCEAIQEE